ncbi:MAG: DNA mismatch repair protein MutS [Spirochaeta sp. LUC14_002_19_P3]|nr:MAG: DNA mismatch repair protein MutS [Spirochaeta sp. LUC14_002_19_P3]
MSNPEFRETTPMLQQYQEHKSRHKDAVLFFRMGDFYEMFRSDAVEISRILNLTLTKRQGIPMCGIPHHAAGNYIARLLKMGRKVAVCEQIELPKGGKGIAKREVIEVVTPGTVVDDNYLDERRNNYLAALASADNGYAYAYIDLSTGEFRVTLLSSMSLRDALRREMAKTSPREIIIPQGLLDTEQFSFLNEESIALNRIPDWSLDVSNAEERLKRQFGTVNLKAFEIEGNAACILASGAILEYIEDNHNKLLSHVKTVNRYSENDSVGLDESTIRNLEIVQNLQDSSKHYTLLETLDHTKTSAGARLLRKRLLQPFPSLKTIEDYHNRVEALYHQQSVLSQLRGILSGIQDIERLTARTAMDRAHAKDLTAIRYALEKFLKIQDILDTQLWDADSSTLSTLFARGRELAAFLASALMDDPSILLTEGRLIRDGWNPEVDRMRSIQKDGKILLNEYIAEEKAATGLSSLKLKYNRVLGYFIEISKNQASKAPERYRRRQMLTQADRFSTQRLDELETEISSVAEKLVDREKDLFLDIREKTKTYIDDLLETARLLADIDLIQSYAHAATEYGYIRPLIVENSLIDIRGGRHPVVERHLPHGKFVPNDIVLSNENVSFALVTGPNMAGKSTVLRQTALITLMAQAGSFVPADDARIGIVDRIFCRVGASDNLARGESTFLVEMNETANILRNATARSLVIMDEVGRGTGTADGLAIARAVCEYLLDNQSPRTLFATHYRELTSLQHKKLTNLSMAVDEIGSTIVFPKKLVPGPAEASYGIHVAALAGLPELVVKRARYLLEHIHEESPPAAPKPTQSEPLLFDPRDLVTDALAALNIDTLTPLKALQLLDQWKKELDTP